MRIVKRIVKPQCINKGRYTAVYTHWLHRGL